MNTFTHTSMNAEQIGEASGASYRQLDGWARLGHFGEHQRGLGNGAIRTWTATDAEVAYALKRSSDLGSGNAKIGTVDYPRIVADAVRSRPVNPEGEWLVVASDGTARRHNHLCLDDRFGFDAARIIRLRSFSSGVTIDDPPRLATPDDLAPARS